MSLKCSVFGHRFGDPEVEREREEQGSEVVITITETERCQRCGESRVVSENKEVTTLETPSDIVGDDLEDADDTVDDAPSDTDSDAGSTEPVSAADEPTESPDQPDDTSGEPPEMGTPEDHPQTESGVADRPAPQATDQQAGGADSQPVPEPETVDAGEDDAVILDGEEETAGDEGRAPGEWPQEEVEDEPDDDWVPTGTEDELRPVEEEQPEVEPTGSAVTVPEGEFHCPECGFTTAVESSSLREGDFCPECHRGSLEHHPQ